MGNSRSSCVTDRKIDVRPQTGTAPDGPTDMREPANKSLLTDVSGLRFHPCTIIPTHALPQFLETPFVMPYLLNSGHKRMRR